MKKISILLTVLLVCLFGIFAIGSGESSTDNQGDGNANGGNNGNLGMYSVVIESSRLAEDYEGKPVIIVTYKYTNVSNDTPTAFCVAFDDNAYQNGVGLNEAYFLADNVNYNSDNQTKEIKKGASLSVEIAYSLNDTTTDVEIEVEQLFSLDSKKVTKTFKLK